MSEKIKSLRKLAKNGVLTHNSKFHADDVFAAALLKLAGIINSVSEIKRVGHVPEGFNGLAFDIGGGKFDHHQDDAPVRTNGDKYAAFGLLWKEIGAEYIQKKYNVDAQTAIEAAKKFDTDFVAPIDLTDNFGAEQYPNTMSFLVSSMNNMKYTDEENKKQFIKIVNDMKKYLGAAIEKSCNFIKDRNRAKELASSDFIILALDDYVDRNAFRGTRVKYIVKKSHRGTYNVTTVEPYKIPPYCKEMPGCVQVYKIGAAFDRFYDALVAAKRFVMDIKQSK